jgi:ABC-type glycerol-3-phosphate transport system substrate-binding protein
VDAAAARILRERATAIIARASPVQIIQDALGTHVNAFLVGQETAEEALAAAQQQVEDNWQ